MKHRLVHAPELLDDVPHDEAELAQSLAQVAEVNRLLGGTRAVLLALTPLLATHGVTRVLDIGTGSADIPLAIARWAHTRRRRVNILATDVHAQMCAIASARTRSNDNITIGAADARALPFARNTFDIVLLSLTLHHFEQEDQLRVLREAARVARRAVIINELERNRSNYWGARLLAATRWRNNRLTRHDGPLSVLRAFTRDELEAVAQQAGLRIEGVRRRFFYRLVLIADAREK